MRVTRYLWINNLPARVTEQDIRDVLQSHGKIQSVRIHEHDGNNGAVVAFVDTKSATRAVESTVRLKKVNLSLQYCESSGIPGNNSTEQLSTSADYTQTSNTSLFQSDGNYSQQKSRSVSTVSDSSSVFHDPDSKEQSQTCLSNTATNRSYSKDSKAANMNTSPHPQNEHRGLKITHLPLRSSDTNLREGLFHEYKKHGKITSVFVRGQDEERICIITFKRSEDAERALASSKGKVFFGTPISVHPHEGLNAEDPDLCPPEHALDEYHPKATKTLFVGNLCSGTITQDELRRTFRGYGEIIEIDIKIQANQPGTSYAFIQYGDIKSVVRALKDQETVRVNGKPVKLGFGKSQPTNVVWLDNLSPTINEAFLTRQFGRYGQLTHVVLDRKSMRALLYFDNVEVAQHAVNETRNRALVGRKVQIDYAGYECQVAFMRKLAKHDSFGQVYENYKERLQEVLSLLPYGGVMPYLGDRQRYFGDGQRDHFPSGNTKFSYRRSNCIRNSPVDRSLKYEPSSNRNKCMSPISPRSRSHLSSDRRRTFITSSPDEPRLSCNWVGSHSSRSSHLKNVQSEDRSSMAPHKKYQHGEIPTKSKTSRHVPHADTKSNSNYRPHIDQSCSRIKGQLLEETDDISSGSFSSGFTNDDSICETSSLRHSNSSSDYSAPTSKLPSHVSRDHVLGGDKRKNIDADISVQKNARSSRHETVPVEDSPYSSNKKHAQRSRESASPQLRTNSTRTSRLSSSHHRTNSVSDRNLSRGDSSHEHLEDSINQKHNKTNMHFQSRMLIKSSDNDYSSPSYTSSKSKRVLLSSVASAYKDPEYSKQSNTTISPVSPDDFHYHKTEDTYARVTNSSDLPIAAKSHDTLTKLEMERAKLLRELSLLNNEVIGGSRGKTINYTNNVDDSKRKRARSSSMFLGDLPSPKLKCVDSGAKCELAPIQNPIFTNEELINRGTRKFTSNSHSMKHMATVHDSKCSLPTSTQGTGDMHAYVPPMDSHFSRSDAASPSQKTSLTKPSMYNAHNSSRSVVPESVMPNSSNFSVSRQTVLMTSSPRMIVPPEPTSPMVHITPPSSPLIMDKSSYAFTPNATFSSSLSATSNSGSISSSLANSCSRDPRLAIFHNQLSSDIPPPPPETFKLPLWVDTSPHTELISNSVTNRILKAQSPPFTKSLCDVEHDISTHDSNGCSLDERIRLLDVQLMKSEKARPTVDYSKFRIRRKAEPNLTPQSSQSTIATPCISGISVVSCSPHSPVLTVSTFSVSNRNELAVSDAVNSGLPVSCTSSILPTSPILSNASSLSLIKPADTSEFVKSMLSFSKPSPSTPCSDPPNNFFANEVQPAARHPVSVPQCTNSFLSRLPRSCISNSTSAMSPIQSSISNYNKQTISNNRIHPNACNVEHSSLSGAQPVGVATRMPSVRLSSGPDALSKVEDNELITKCTTKFSTKRENLDYIEKYESEILPQSHTNTSTDLNTGLSSLITDSQKGTDVSSKVSAYAVSPLTGSTNGVPLKTNQKPVNSNSKSSPRDDIISSNKCKSASLSNSTPTNTKKLQKHDSSRSVLDDFVFQNSLGAVSSKVSRPKKAQVDSSSVLPSKRKCSTASESKEGSISDADKKVPENTSVPKGKVSEKMSCKNISKKLQSTTDGAPQKESVSNCKAKSGGDGNRLAPASNNRSMLSSEKKIVSPCSKKKKSVRDIKKKIIDSEDSDWEPNAIEGSHPRDLLDDDSLSESRFESMYDKIKRRANQSTTKSSDSLVKTDVLQRFLKVRGKQSKKDSQKSPADSDTDECLSDGSSSHSDCTSITLSKRSAKSNSSTNETVLKPVKQKVSTSSGAKSSPLPTLSPKRKKLASESDVSTSNESSQKTRGRKGKKSNVSNVPRTTQVRHQHKDEQQKTSTSGGRSTTRRKKSCAQEDTSAHESESASGCTTSAAASKVKKQKVVPTENKKRLSVKNTHRSLVHRVFASTDSSSLSSSVMSDSSDDEISKSNSQVSKSSIKEKINDKEMTQEENDCQSMLSKSPSSRVSRSCSPEDLRADAAIRHTFGAFTAPFLSLKNDLPHTSGIKQNVPQTDMALKFSPNSEDSRPTPPTLPMTDSSFSGDQQSNGGNIAKRQTRDPSDWNIFSSLTKQSTPIKDDNIHQNLSSSPMHMIEGDNTPANVAGDTSYDTEDELPSLEKHDEDEVSNPYESSILLHESDSFINRAESLNVYNDDDLPPPVVSEVDHQLSYSDAAPVSTATVPDIIEEVIYDGLEVPVSEEGHPTANASMKSNSCKNSPIIDKASSNIPHNLVEITANDESEHPSFDTVDIPHADVGSLTQNLSLDGTSLVTSTVTTSVNSATVQSAVFTPVAVLSATEQTKDSQAVLVTIPTTVSTNLNSPKYALVTDVETSVSYSCSSLSPSINSVSQSHVAVILPTTSMSVSRNSPSTVASAVLDSHNSATSVSSVPISGDSFMSPSSVSSVNLTNGQLLYSYTTQTDQTLTYHSLTTGITTSACTNSSLENSISSSYPCLSSTAQVGNSTFDPTDFTSYVQRVIERVKQEKDEEIMQQREKVKRPKRNTSLTVTSALTMCSTTNGTSTVISVTSPCIFSPTTITLPTVPVVPSIPTADVPKSQNIVISDDKNVIVSMCSVNNSTTQDTHSSGIKSIISPNHQPHSVLDSPITTSAQQITADTYAEQNLLNSGCNTFGDDSQSRDKVDNTIEAVVNGEFDEKEYVLKILKGTFIHNGHCRTLSGSVGSPSSQSDMLTLVPEDSSVKNEHYQSNVSESVYVGSPTSTFNVGVHSSCPVPVSKAVPDPISSNNQSSGVLTPMHVLTFVAANASTSSSQHTSTSSVTSPDAATQAVSNLTTSTHQLPPTLSSSNSGLDKVTDVTPLASYTAIPNSTDSSNNSTNTRIGEFAARLANNPFTTYFYSLLTQKQLSPSSLSPSISSSDPLCQRPNDNITLPLCSTTTLKNLSIPNASVSGDTADYLAAATMAAMAAMAGPTQDMTSFGQTGSSSSYSDSKAALSESQFLQMWSTAHLRIQEYPVIWRGRLSLKNEEVFVNMHYISGNQDLLKSCMGVIAEQQVALSNITTSASSMGSCLTTDTPGSLHQPLKIVQRMRLEASQLEGVQRKLRQLNDFCMCLTLATVPPLTPEASVSSEQIRMNRILCDGFIKYMLDKCAAGIINVCHPCTQQNLYVIHIFPPCDFSRCQLQVCAPALSHTLMENSIPHVLTVITTV
ncbi:unnamed protein product [Trichobilharzia szidati]|nr:unnamed protein product [Trichobilharzia szidati]